MPLLDTAVLPSGGGGLLPLWANSGNVTPNARRAKIYAVTVRANATSDTTAQLFETSASGRLRWETLVRANTTQHFVFDEPLYFPYAPWLEQTNPGRVTLNYIQLGQ